MICTLLPVAIEYRKIARMWLGSDFEYAIQRESGDHAASKPRCGSSYQSESIFVKRPVEMASVQSCALESLNSMCCALGDHTGFVKYASVGNAIARGFDAPV